MNSSSPEFFDPKPKEAQPHHESQSWDTSQVQAALPGDIPEIDVAEYFTTLSDAALDAVAVQFRSACQETGFCSIVGHQFPSSLIKRAFVDARRFFALPTDIKHTLLMDRPDWPVKAVGYLAVNNYKLPAREKGNLNETFVIKRDHQVGLEDNQWPNEDQLPEFRANTEHYAGKMENLAKRLLPIYARALELEKNFFAPAFTKPLYRLRMTHYPLIEDKAADAFGIAPHVDTTFFTLLAQNSPGLVIFSENRQCWIHAPVNENAFIVNTGELLKHWSNDFFISVKHFANNNTGDAARYSLPFFFNANPDYKMECLPTCCSADNPPKYPPISYLQSQGVVQGE